MDRFEGRVAWFNNTKGFGFITADNGPDVFCHYTAIQETGYKKLIQGDAVEFEIESGPGGRPQAAFVTRRLPEASAPERMDMR